MNQSPAGKFEKTWTQQEEAALRHMCAMSPPISFTEIAKTLSKTRNAVIGKTRKMGIKKLHFLTGKPAKTPAKGGGRKPSRQSKKKTRKPKRNVPIVFAPLPMHHMPFTARRIGHECGFLVAPGIACGSSIPQEENRSRLRREYCEYHGAICTEKRRGRKPGQNYSFRVGR